MEVSEIISLIKARNKDGLSELYNNYSGALNGIIIRIVGSDKIAEEILQQTFLKIWEKIEQYDDSKSTLFTWMARVARNSAIDAVRLKKFQNQALTDSWEAKHNDSKQFTSKFASIDTANLMSTLEPKYKEVLDCIYLQGYSQSQAAIKLDIPLGTVKSRIRIALSTLRDSLISEKTLFVGSFIFLIYLYGLSCL